VQEFPEVDYMTPTPITDCDFKDIMSVIITVEFIIKEKNALFYFLLL